MTSWIVDAPTDPRRFPQVRHRHPNGTLAVERDRMPTVVHPLGGERIERWSHVCACGEIYIWERKVQ